MAPYIIALAATLLLCVLLERPQAVSRGRLIKTFPHARTAWIVLLPLIFLALFRWNVGADSVYGSSYWTSYHASADGINDRDFEIGFYWFMRVFAELEVPFFWFLFAHGVVFFTLICYAMYRGSVSPVWSIVVFFCLTIYFDAYSSLRQSLAEGICLVGWAKMGAERDSRKKHITILLLFVVSTLFHSTGWLNIPVYLLSQLRFRRRGDILVLAIIAVACTPVLQRVIPIFMDLLAPEGKYSTMGLARINIGVTGLLFAFSWLFYDEITWKNEMGYKYINQALYIFILLLNSGAMYLPYRVYDMLKIGFIFIIPQIMQSIRDCRSRFLVKTALVALFALLFLNFINQPESPYPDYQWIFSDFWTIINLP